VIDILRLLAPTQLDVGDALDTGERVLVDVDEFYRGVGIVGAVGEGKTDFVTEFLRAHAFGGNGWAVLDLAGTGCDHLAAFDALACTLLKMAVDDLAASDCPEAAQASERFMARHAYVNVGEDDPAVRINILRRLVRRDGRRETPQQVAGRFVDVFGAQFGDIAIRVQFMKWTTVLATLLAAADRPVAEYALLFEREDYRAFLHRAQKEAGTAGDPFVREQWAILGSQYLSLRKQPGDGMSPRQADEVSSTHNALGPLRSGPMAAFFGAHENLQLEDIAFHGGRLAVTTTALANVEHRKFVLRAVWAALDGLVTTIKQDDPVPVSFAVFDEVAQLTMSHVTSFATLRNHRWSPIVLRQTHDAQFEQLGMPKAAAILAQCLRYQIYGRPETEAIARTIAVRGPMPDYESLIVNLLSRSRGISTTEARGRAVAWADSFADGGTRRSLTDQVTLGTQEGETEHPVRIGIDEQLLRRTLETVHLPAHCFVHVAEGRARTIRHRRARQMPRTLFGIDHVARYLAANRRLHDRTATPCRPFDPTIDLRTDEPAARPSAAGAARPFRPGRRAGTPEVTP